MKLAFAKTGETAMWRGEDVPVVNPHPIIMQPAGEAEKEGAADE